jgi:hypothetical protein
MNIATPKECTTTARTAALHEESKIKELKKKPLQNAYTILPVRKKEKESEKG